MKSRSSAASADAASGPRYAFGIGRPVDLRRERPEPLLVRMGLRRHRQRHPRPAVERPFERDDALPLRVQPGELDGVLDRLGAGVEERGARLSADRDERAEPFRELDVALVGDRPCSPCAGSARPARRSPRRTRGWLWPTFATPTPPTKSTNVLPSTSVIVEPRARSATIGSWTISGCATACCSRSRISRLRGPGISVRISITRVAATRGSLAVRPAGEARAVATRAAPGRRPCTGPRRSRACSPSRRRSARRRSAPEPHRGRTAPRS